MQYQIKGDSLPVAICQLSPGESLISEAGAMDGCPITLLWIQI